MGDGIKPAIFIPWGLLVLWGSIQLNLARFNPNSGFGGFSLFIAAIIF